jgi:PAS domain S-box-containing protein
VEIAAKVTAEALKARLDGGKNSRNAKPKTVTKDRRPYSGMQHEVFDRNQDSVITRTLDGKITSWNRYSEELYGWTKEDAIGKVSHILLHTQFPEPLEQIDAELVQSGRWEGKLVHVTRDGRRVVVESRWNLKKGSDAVIEINTPSADSLSRNSHRASDSKQTVLR